MVARDKSEGEEQQVAGMAEGALWMELAEAQPRAGKVVEVEKDMKEEEPL